MFPPKQCPLCIEVWLSSLILSANPQYLAKGSVIASMEMSVRVIHFRSSGLFWSASHACIITSSHMGLLQKLILHPSFFILWVDVEAVTEG